MTTTTATARRPHSRPRARARTHLRAGAALFLASLRMLGRDRAALVATTVFPLLFVLVFALFDLSITTEGLRSGGAPSADAIPYFDFVLPGLLAMGLMQFTMVGSATAVARFRELGVLRRLAVTPLSPVAFVAGQVGARLVAADVQVLGMLAVGVALGAEVTGSIPLLLGFATLGNLVFLGLGLGIAGRASTVDGASSIAGIATAPLMFLSGMFFPVETMPAAVQWVARALPITPLIEGMRAVALDGAGTGDVRGPLAVLAAWAVAAVVVARGGVRLGAR